MERAPYVVRHVDDRIELMVTGRWEARIGEVIEAEGVDRLVLNSAHGFDEPDLAFLRGLRVKELEVWDERVRDLEPIYDVVGLEMLGLVVDTHARLELRRLPGLRGFSATWSQIQGSLPTDSDLRYLHLNGYRGLSLQELEAFGSLHELRLADRPSLRSLKGLERLPEVTTLVVVSARRLSDLSALEGRRGLEVLELAGDTSIANLDFLRGCLDIRYLNISECGDIESCAPIGGLDALEKLFAYGSTRFMDGDLSPLTSLPKLRELRLQSRRRYRPPVSEIETLVDTRRG